MVSRAEKSAFGEWWWTVDRLLLLGFLVLIGGGVVMSFAASPGAAAREGLPVYHFIERHLFYVIPAVIVLIATSFLSPRDVRRLCLLLLVISLVALFLTQFIGVENKGRGAGCGLPASPSSRPNSSSRLSLSSVPGCLAKG